MNSSVRIVSTIALLTAVATATAVTMGSGHLPLGLVVLVDVLVLVQCSLNMRTPCHAASATIVCRRTRTGYTWPTPGIATRRGAGRPHGARHSGAGSHRSSV